MISLALSALSALFALFSEHLKRPDFQEAARFACTLRIHTRNKNVYLPKYLNNCISILFEDDFVVTYTMINGNTVTVNTYCQSVKILLILFDR